MNLVTTLTDLVLHLDRYLGSAIADYGLWTHLLLFAIIFCETGFVVTPFLPGDSLLFAAGSFAAIGALHPTGTIAFLAAAAIAGDTVNYWLGRKVGPGVSTRQRSRLFRKEHLEETRLFYERHGAKTIVIARFVPIIRTFAPFVAGIGSMAYRKFLWYNVLGGVSWVVGLVLLGYFFGNIPFVKGHFSVVIMVIVVISVIPAVVGYLRRNQGRTSADYE